MLLGGIKGKKNQTPNKAKQTNHQKTALWEVSGTVLNVLPSSEAWLLAERKETSRTHCVYRAPPAGTQLLFWALPHALWYCILAAAWTRGDDASFAIQQMGKPRLKETRQARASGSPGYTAGGQDSNLHLFHTKPHHHPLTCWLLLRLSWSPNTDSGPSADLTPRPPAAMGTRNEDGG